MKTRLYQERIRDTSLDRAAIEAGIEVEEQCTALIRQAWIDMMDAPPASHQRARFMNIVALALKESIQIQQSLGVRPKRPDVLSIINADLSKLTDKDLAEVSAFLQALQAGDSGNGHA